MRRPGCLALIAGLVIIAVFFPGRQRPQTPEHEPERTAEPALSEV